MLIFYHFFQQGLTIIGGLKHSHLFMTDLTEVILVAGGHSETLNGRGGKQKTSVKEAAPSETSTPIRIHSALNIRVA